MILPLDESDLYSSSRITQDNPLTSSHDSLLKSFIVDFVKIYLKNSRRIHQYESSVLRKLKLKENGGSKIGKIRSCKGHIGFRKSENNSK